MAGEPNYKVLPLPMVQKWAKRALSREQLRAGINLARRLRFYPNVEDLSIGPCGDGIELRIDHPKIGKQGWLRAAFHIDEKSKTIYIVDLFWKKENAIRKVDMIRINSRIRRLKAALTRGGKPWA